MRPARPAQPSGHGLAKLLCKMRNGTALQVAEPSAFLEIPVYATSGHESLWLAFSGYLAGATSSGFAKDSDAAILHLSKFLQAGHRFAEISKMDGAFAALLVSPDRGWFSLVRDRLGGRSAYYIDQPGLHAASTHLAHLAGLQSVDVSDDPSYLATFFNLQIATPDGHSPVRRIKAVRPGESVECDELGTRKHRQPFEFITADSITQDDWVESFHEEFVRSVKGSLSDKRGACLMLSGGLDSGPIAAVGSRLQGPRDFSAVSWSLKAFPTADEVNFARQVATQSGIRLELFDGSDRLPFNDLRMSPECPTYHAFQGLNEGCYERAVEAGHSVLLNGASGDLLYPHPDWFLYELLRRRSWGALLGKVRSWAGSRKKGAPLSNSAVRYALRRLVGNSTRTSARPAEWLDERARSYLAEVQFWPPEAKKHPVPQYAAKLLDTGFGYSASQEHYNAERFGLQRRDPFVSQPLIQLMLSMPFSLTRKQLETKWIMREAMRREPGLPESIRTKPRTGVLHDFFDTGFWRNRDRLEDLLMREKREWQNWVKRDAVVRAFDRQRSTRGDRVLASHCIGYVLWRDEISKLRAAS